VLKNKDPDSVVTDAGKMVGLDHEFVVLHNATRATRFDVTVPILGHLPFIGRLFRFTALRSEELPGTLKVRRTEVASVKLLSD
jgi:hypothetical protein